MKVLCDVHPPYRLVNQLRERGANTALLTLFDEHWNTLTQVLADSPRYVELGSAGIVVFEE